MKVLIVESDKAFSGKLQQSLEKAGIGVFVHSVFETALSELLKPTTQFDVLLVSKESVKGDEGLELLEKIRGNTKLAQSPIVLMSSQWTKADFAKHQKTSHGANAFFQKSAQIAEIQSVLESITGVKAKAEGTTTKSVTKSTGSLNIKLLPVEEVLTNFSDMRKGIELSEPINLFDEAAQKQKTPSLVKEEPPKVEAPKVEEIKIEVSKVEEPKVEAPKVEEIKIEVSKVEEPKVETPKVEEVQFEAPKVEVPKVEAPKIEEPKIEEPKIEEPKIEEPASEEEAARDLPYLFSGTSSIKMSVPESSQPPAPSSYAFSSKPVFQTGTSSSDDVEALKKYLTMREQDISVLSVQLNYAKDELVKSEEMIRKLSQENEDYFHQVNDLKNKLSDRDSQLQAAGKNMQGEVEDLRHELKTKIDRIRYLEEKLDDSANQYEKLKDRVRLDIRKIRVREKELESKLEILKKDSETLIASRENKILELKRKIDLIEFNYDTLLDKNEQEKEKSKAYNDKIGKIEKVLRLAIGVVSAEEEQQQQQEEKQEENAA